MNKAISVAPPPNATQSDDRLEVNGNEGFATLMARETGEGPGDGKTEEVVQAADGVPFAEMAATAGVGSAAIWSGRVPVDRQAEDGTISLGSPRSIETAAAGDGSPDLDGDQLVEGPRVTGPAGTQAVLPLSPTWLGTGALPLGGIAGIELVDAGTGTMLPEVIATGRPQDLAALAAEMPRTAATPASAGILAGAQAMAEAAIALDETRNDLPARHGPSDPSAAARMVAVAEPAATALAGLAFQRVANLAETALMSRLAAEVQTLPGGGSEAGFGLAGSTSPPAFGLTPILTSAAAAVPHLAAQLVQTLTRHGDGSTEIALSPDELGSVRVTMQPDALNPDRLVVMLNFERPETLDLFRRHADQLAEALRLAGFAGAEIGFGQSGAGGNGSDRGDAGASDQPIADSTAPDPASGLMRDLPALGLAPNGALDLRL